MGAGARTRRTEDDAECRPQDRGIDRESEGEVSDEAVLADLDPVGKAAFDHVPAQRALQKSEEQDAGERRREMPRQAPPRQKPEERDRKRHADQPAQQPVDIFPIIDALKLVQAHRPICCSRIEALWPALASSSRVSKNAIGSSG